MSNSLNDLVATMTKAVEAVRTGEVNADDLIKNIAETKKKDMLSTSPEYQVMNDTDKLECLVKDAENCSPSALILSKDISKEDRSSYDKSLCEIIYGDNDDTLFENVKNLVKICTKAGIEAYRIVGMFKNSGKFEKIKAFDLIKLMNAVSSGVEETIKVESNTAANTFAQQPQQQVTASSIINKVNNTNVASDPFKTAITWLSQNVRFGNKNVESFEVLNLFNMFNYPMIKQSLDNLKPIPQSDCTWYNLTNYEFDKNMYKYAFAARTMLDPNKRIVLLINPVSGAWLVNLVDAASIAA